MSETNFTLGTKRVLLIAQSVLAEWAQVEPERPFIVVNPDYRDVYVAFGATTHVLQRLEAAVLNVIVAWETAMGGGGLASRVESIKRWEPRPLGPTLDRLNDFLALDDDVFQPARRELLDMRNHLAHDFFVERTPDLHSEDGRQRMLKQLWRARDAMSVYYRTLRRIEEIAFEGTWEWAERDLGMNVETYRNIAREEPVDPAGIPLSPYAESVNDKVVRGGPIDRLFTMADEDPGGEAISTFIATLFRDLSTDEGHESSER